MIVISLLVSLLVLAVFRWYFTRLKLPPGPPAVPVLGSLPFLQLRQTSTLQVKDEIRGTNDLKLAKELFDREDFSGRDARDWDHVLKMMNGKLRGIIHTESQNWVKQRRF